MKEHRKEERHEGAREWSGQADKPAMLLDGREAAKIVGEPWKYWGRRWSGMTAEAARKLAEGSVSLELSGLEALDERAAAELARVRGKLVLNGVRKVSGETLRALLGHEGRALSLGGLKELEGVDPAIFREYKGRSLKLDGLEELSPELARGIAGNLGARLSLGGLRTATREVLGELARGYRGRRLYLDGLRTISTSAAGELAKFRGRRLYLGRMDRVAEPALAELARFRGSLYLGAVAGLSREGALALAGFGGKVLHLGGLERIDGLAAAVLARSGCRKLEFEGLRHVPVELAQALRRFAGKLVLGGTPWVDTDAARELGERPVDALDFRKTCSLPPNAAIVLRRRLAPQVLARSLVCDIASAIHLQQGWGDVEIGARFAIDEFAGEELSRHLGRIRLEDASGSGVIAAFGERNSRLQRRLPA